MSKQKQLAPIEADEDFISRMMRLYWEVKHKTEPQQYFSFRDAFQTLIDYTGLSRKILALRLGVTTSYLGMIESGKRLGNQFHYSELKYLAKSYSLPLLADYFAKWEDRAINSQAPSRGRKVKTGSGVGPDWRDEMGNW